MALILAPITHDVTIPYHHWSRRGFNVSWQGENAWHKRFVKRLSVFDKVVRDQNYLTSGIALARGYRAR